MSFSEHEIENFIGKIIIHFHLHKPTNILAAFENAGFDLASLEKQDKRFYISSAYMLTNVFNYATPEGSTNMWFKLTDSGIEAKNSGHLAYQKYLKEKPNNNTNNSIHVGDNFSGNLVQDAFLSERAIKHIVTNEPNAKDIKQNPIIAILKKYWWAFVIPLILGLILLTIEYKWFAVSHHK